MHNIVQKPKYGLCKVLKFYAYFQGEYLDVYA